MKKKLSLITLLVCFAVLFCACAPKTEKPDVPDNAGENTDAVVTPDDHTEPTLPTDSEPLIVNVAALKGPTAIGLVKLIDDPKPENSGEAAANYVCDFAIEASADAVTPKLINGELDMAAVPANLASVLYNRTKGEIVTLNINTLGVLYIVENGDTVQSVADLKGKTIYASGKGSTPEYALNYMLSSAGLAVGQDVFVEYKSEHAECVAALASESNAVAMLPQPFVTTAMMANENIRIALDINKEWESATGNTLVTGVLVARKAFVDEHTDIVESFLKDYEASVDYVNHNVSEAAQLVEKCGIFKADVAEKAIPYCNITFLSGNAMKDKLSAYLAVLYKQNSDAIGGKLPEDSFYYGYTEEQPNE